MKPRRGDGDRNVVDIPRIQVSIYNHDGTTQQVVACGDYLEIDGKGYKMRLSDGEKIDAWADALAEAQGAAME